MGELMSGTRRIRGLGFVAALWVALATTGCNSLPFVGDDDVEMRVENATEEVFTEVRVYWDPMHSFSDLDPGERTAYVTVDRAYNIATLVAVTATDSTRIQVIDFVGEEPLEGGRYTLVLFSANPLGQPLLLAERVEKDS